MLPAIFLDRDGVIIENRDEYVRSWDDVALIPGALEALALASSEGWKLVIISNQAGIGKGLIPPSTANEINHRLVEIIRQHGGRIDGVFICPHTNQDDCECRKPRPGLILRAARDLNIDLSASLLIGDALSDIQAGQNAGLSRLILVQTGRGAEQSLLSQASLLQPFEIYPDLHTAIAELTR